MLTISFRDNLSPKKFHRAMPERIQKAAELIAGAVAGVKPKRVVFVVHGYANDQSDVAKAYAQVDERVRDLETLLVGIEWPSNGGVLGYYADRKDAEQAGVCFAHIINLLTHQMFAQFIAEIPIHIMSHSMGGRVVAESLRHLTEGEPQPNTWVAFNADVRPSKLQEDNDYGKYFGAIDKAYFYFSKEDRVLGIIAPMALPVARVGRVGLCEDKRPPNFYNVDATLLDKEKVRHGHYKESEVLIPHALKLMKGNE